MKCFWLRLLLLGTFAFWASGAAKHVHEALEHHGRDASVEDDDDDNSAIASVALKPSLSDHAPANAPKKPCPICQMLAVMVVDRPAPLPMPISSTLHIDTLVPLTQVAPVLHACFILFARDPPLIAQQI